MEIHKVKCDKCGVETKLFDIGLGSYRLPEGWRRVESSDLCSKCLKLVKQFIKE